MCVNDLLIVLNSKLFSCGIYSFNVYVDIGADVNYINVIVDTDDIVT